MKNQETDQQSNFLTGPNFGDGLHTRTKSLQLQSPQHSKYHLWHHYSTGKQDGQEDNSPSFFCAMVQQESGLVLQN